MTPEAFIEIFRNLPHEDKIAYQNDLTLYGHGFIKKVGGEYRRVPPQDAITLKTAKE